MHRARELRTVRQPIARFVAHRSGRVGYDDTLREGTVQSPATTGSRTPRSVRSQWVERAVSGVAMRIPTTSVPQASPRRDT